MVKSCFQLHFRRQISMMRYDAHENIPSLACLIFFVKLTTENQLIKFEAVSNHVSIRVSRLTLIETWSGIQQSVGLYTVIYQAIDQWRVCLNAKSTGKHFEHAMTCCSTTANNLL